VRSDDDHPIPLTIRRVLDEPGALLVHGIVDQQAIGATRVRRSTADAHRR